ncbi:MAG: hypothetical protein GEV12_13520 [Micromonosporaceae bacterium]|nr:hypothetical protein [Micromonosporaceae bacterium]
MRPLARLAALLPVGALLLAGCGPPPGLDDDPRGPAGSGAPTTGASSPAFPPNTAIGPSGGPGLSPAEGAATDCAGQPDGEEVLDLLRDEEVLGTGAEAEVVEGPLCADTWQYAVVNVPDLDPLQVVTRGEDGDLELVTAGTDVCTVEVRIQAPPGIRDAASCVS